VNLVPERFVPGLLDIFGHSHQWWHIIIVLAFMHWHQTVVGLAAYRFENGCGAAPPSDNAIEVLNKMWEL
jgi:hypothetical protein